MPPGSERRRATRILTTIEARLGCGGAEFPLHLLNLSIVGFLGEPTIDIHLGASCTVALSGAGSLVEASGTVVRNDDQGLAVRFDELPFESYENLRDFLFANAEDPAKIADELADRIGFLDESPQ